MRMSGRPNESLRQFKFRNEPLALLVEGKLHLQSSFVRGTASETVIFNARFATYLAGIAAFALSAWIALTAASPDPEEENFPWLYIAGGSVIAVNILIMIAVCLEIHSYWWAHLPARWQWSDFIERRMYAQFTYSAWSMLFGALLLAVGFWKKSAFLRWQALILIALTTGKVFLIDVSQLGGSYRILSFVVLGVVLLAISYVYQRDWLKLSSSATNKTVRENTP